jgi:hypothetical protein
MEITREGSTENTPPASAAPAGLLGTYTHGMRALALTGLRLATLPRGKTSVKR